VRADTPDHRFLDAVGLTSPEVLDVYRRGADIGAFVSAKSPHFAADSLFATAPPVTYNAARYLLNASSYVSTKPAPLRDAGLVHDRGVLHQCGAFGVGRIGP
jgi:hypothetical protein